LVSVCLEAAQIDTSILAALPALSGRIHAEHHIADDETARA